MSLVQENVERELFRNNQSSEVLKNEKSDTYFFFNFGPQKCPIP